VKESDIMQPIIDKCREIAKYWRMELYEGCWIRVANKTRLVISIIGEYFFTNESYTLGNPQFKTKSGFPILSIYDCLEKIYNSSCPFGTFITLEKRFKDWSSAVITTKELHETLLSVLLEVLRETTIKENNEK